MASYLVLRPYLEASEIQEAIEILGVATFQVAVAYLVGVEIPLACHLSSTCFQSFLNYQVECQCMVLLTYQSNF